MVTMHRSDIQAYMGPSLLIILCEGVIPLVYLTQRN